MTTLGLRFVPSVGDHTATFKTGTSGQGLKSISRQWSKEGGGDPPAPGSATLTLSVPDGRTTMTAPGGFLFEATLAGADVDDWRKDPVFKWTFGVPGKVFTQLPTDYFWRDQNTNWGRRVLMAYHPSPAEFGGQAIKSYTITCECRLQNRTTGDVEAYIETITVNLRNPDHATHEFAGTNTICISATGATGQEPSGAQVVTTWTAAADAAAGKNNYRILFNGGQTYTFAASDTINFPGGHNPTGICHVGTYPHGTRADCQWSNGCSGTMLNISRDFESSQEVSAWGMGLVGTYDATDPYSIQDGPIGQGVAIASFNKISSGIHELDVRYLLMDLDISGVNQCFSVSNQTAHYYIFNCRVSSWGDYGFFQGRGWDYTGISGVYAKQPIGTWTGDGTKQDATDHPGYHVANHGPGRFTSPPFRATITKVDLRSLNSWGGGKAGMQPAWRNAGRDPIHPYSTENGELADLYFGCWRVEAAGEIASYGASIGEGDDQADAVCMVVEKIYMIGWGTDRMFGTAAPGLTLRNSIVVWPEMTTPGGDGEPTGELWLASYCEAGGSSSFYPYVYANYPLEHYSNTIVDRRSDAQAGGKLETGTDTWDLTGQIPYFQGDPSLYSVIRRHNLVLYGENWPAPGDAVDDFVMTSVWTPEMNGYYRMVTYPNVTYPGVVFLPEDAPACIPGAGSAARGGANTTTEKWALDDIWGNWRDPANVSRGAVEPNTTT